MAQWKNTSSCKWCGRRGASDLCSSECRARLAQMEALPLQVVSSYAQAAAYLGRDSRTIRRYEGTLFRVDRALPKASVKWRSCQICGASCKTGENRNGYCSACSSAGEGRRAQAACLAKRHQGAGNPNFAGGHSQSGFRQSSEGKAWARSALERDKICRVCGGAAQLQAHHVLPCAPFPELENDVKNGITLRCFHRTELHRREKDLRLLPSLYASKSDALPWHEALGRQDQFRALAKLAAKPTRKRELLRVVPKNYRKRLLGIHPQFARRELGLEASK